MENRFFIQLIYALSIGVLVGLERSVGVVKEHRKQLEGKAEDIGLGEFLGIRTFAVISLAGFSAALVAETSKLIAPLALLSVAALIVAKYLSEPVKDSGITTEVAAVATFVLGMLCRLDHSKAGIAALILTVVLASKSLVHSAARKMRPHELTDTLKFLAVILIVLPLLPNRAIDPWDALNPTKIGLLVVLISGIGFVGYFLTRILGAQKGLGLTGVVGGLTSSTAVTAAMAVQARKNPDLRLICAFSTIIANATMFLRVLVVVAVIDSALVAGLSWSLGTMAGVALVAAGIAWVWAGRERESASENTVEIEHQNPFSLAPALKFAAFFVVILIGAKLATKHFGDQGLYLASALSGLADVDAITLSIAEQTGAGEIAHSIGAVAITIAVVSNSIVKTGIAMYSGGWRFGRIIGLGLGLATVSGLLVVVLV